MDTDTPYLLAAFSNNFPLIKQKYGDSAKHINPIKCTAFVSFLPIVLNLELTQIDGLHGQQQSFLLPAYTPAVHDKPPS